MEEVLIGHNKNLNQNLEQEIYIFGQLLGLIVTMELLLQKKPSILLLDGVLCLDYENIDIPHNILYNKPEYIINVWHFKAFGISVIYQKT